MVDLVKILDAPTAIVGTTGAGKTFTAKGAVERLLLLGRRVIVLDPTGAWWGLRSGADGRESGGYPVTIFGGSHADVDITPDGEAGKTLALALADREVQAIIDTSEMTGGEKNRFLTPFLEHLYARNKAALHLIVDEADEVAAQQLADGEQRLFGAFDKIVRRGRIKGFRVLMISQRPAVIHKNVLSQVGTLIAMKLTSPQDRKAIDQWVKGNADADKAKTVMSSLPTLQRGEGWVWSPAANVLERVSFPAIGTFDSSRTPEVDDAIVEPALTAVDVAALRDAMQASRKTAGQGSEAQTGRASAGLAAEDIKAAEQRGYDRGWQDGLTEGEKRGAVRGAAVMLATVQTTINAFRIPDILEANDITAGSPSGKAADFDSATDGSNPSPATIPTPAKPKQARPAKAPGADPLLEAARQVWPVKMTWGGLAAMCGRKARGGHFNTTRKRLIDSGTVREDGALVVLCDPPAAPSGVIPADLLEQNLPQPSAKMFAAIRRRPGITPAGLAAELGMQPRGGHWNNGMAILRRNDLITESDGLRIAARLEGE